MKIERVKQVDLTMLQRMVKLEIEAFGHGGLNEWHLVPFIRHGRVFLASDKDAAVGLIQYMRDWDNPRKAYLIGVSVAKAWRGQGVGTRLMQVSLEALKEENVDEVELTVDPENKGAIKLYVEKLGFMVKETRVSEYGAGEDRVVMTLSLDKMI